jgi:hypothetical protein
MSTIRNPVGPQPANVYFRRRLIVLGGLVAVIVIILLIVFAPKGGDEKPGASETPKPTTSSSAPPVSADPSACDPAVISLEAITDAGSYPSGVNPLISMRITNNGAAACTLNVGTDVQEYKITSGNDEIWTSKDCQANPAENEILIEPGADNAQSTTPFAWDRTRSSADTCDGTRPGVTGGGASYHLTVLLGDVESEETKQFLLL